MIKKVLCNSLETKHIESALPYSTQCLQLLTKAFSETSEHRIHETSHCNILTYEALSLICSLYMSFWSMIILKLRKKHGQERWWCQDLRNNCPGKMQSSYSGIFVDIWECTTLNAKDKFLYVKLTVIIFTQFGQYIIEQI